MLQWVEDEEEMEVEGNNRKKQLMFLYQSQAFPKKIHPQRIVNLLYIEDDMSGSSHYALFSSANLHGFSKKSVCNQNPTRGIYLFCSNCCTYSTQRKDVLDRHMELCFRHESLTQVTLPSCDKYGILAEVKFTHHQYKLKQPFYATLDFEATLLEIEEEGQEIAKTRRVYQHIPNSCGVLLVCPYLDRVKYPDFDIPEMFYQNQYRVFTNENVDSLMEEVITWMEMIVTDFCYPLFKRRGDIDLDTLLTPDQLQAYERCNPCPDCRETFSLELRKVRDHDHITGEYRGSLYSKCNLKKPEHRKFPIFAHNLTGYDSHFLIGPLALYGQQSHKQINCIASTMSQYKMFSK